MNDQTELTSQGRLFKVSLSLFLIHCKDLSFNHLYYSSETIIAHNRAVCASEKTEHINEKTE